MLGWVRSGIREALERTARIAAAGSLAGIVVPLIGPQRPRLSSCDSERSLEILGWLSRDAWIFFEMGCLSPSCQIVFVFQSWALCLPQSHRNTPSPQLCLVSAGSSDISFVHGALVCSFIASYCSQSRREEMGRCLHGVFQSHLEGRWVIRPEE